MAPCSRSQRRIVSCALVVLLVAVLVPVAPPQARAAVTLYVNGATGNDTTGDGSSANPYKTISKGAEMAALAGGGIVNVAPGTYTEAAGEEMPILVQPDVMIVGNGESPSDVVVDGTGSGDSVFSIGDGDSDTGLDSLAITGGGGDEGGGVTIQTTTGSNRPTIGWCYFGGNAVSGSGGAIKLSGAKATIRSCTFVGNSAADGGAIDIVGGGHAYVIDSTFEDDTASVAGGAIHVYTGAVNVIGCTFMRETSTGSGWYAGAIFADNAAATIGVSESRFIECATAGDGGAIYVSDSLILSVTNCIFDRCSADRGGAIHVGATELAVYYSTFSGNTATGSGKTFYVNNPAENFIIGDSIVWGDGGDTTGQTEPDAVTYTCSQNAAWTGVGVTHADPRFVDAAGGDFRLRNGSPCIDSANAADASPIDIDGVARPQDGDGNGTVAPDMGAFERAPLVFDRIKGDNRYETACEIWRSRMTTAETAVIVTGENFPDALSASALAGAVNGPLLLVQKNSVPPEVSALLADLGVTKCTIVGGTAAVSPGVETALKAHYAVTRIAGSNRYETAANVAREVVSLSGGDWYPMVFIATGASFPDALAASPIAYANRTPILLTSASALPAATRQAIVDCDPVFARVIGGATVVSDAVKNDLGGLGSISSVERWSGANRYATATAVAANATGDHLAYYDYVGIATGANFPDALAGGAACGTERGVILLTDPVALSPATRTLIETDGGRMFGMHVFGGTGAVSDGVRAAIDAIWP